MQGSMNSLVETIAPGLGDARNHVTEQGQKRIYARHFYEEAVGKPAYLPHNLAKS